MVLRVAIRADASADIGTGHVRRCLALAQALEAAGAEVALLCRPLDAVSRAAVVGSAIPVVWLPPAASEGRARAAADDPPHAAWARVPQDEDAQQAAALLAPQGLDWIVVDHYAFDRRWHVAMRRALGCRVAVIDDLADRPLDADVLVDQNWSEDHARKYAARLLRPGSTRLLAGPRHALLAPAFRSAAPCGFRERVQSIGVFMGGTDPGGASARVLAACDAAGFHGPVEVVSTSANPHLPQLREACARRHRTTLSLDLPDLSAFFARHDLQVGAGGGATWERCCLGAPQVAVMVAENQRSVVPALARLGVLEPATLEEGPLALPRVIGALLRDAARRRELARASRTLVDGRGAERVALGLAAGSVSVRPATLDDGALPHAWRNHPDVRAVSRDTGEIALAAHLQWMQKVLRDPARLLLLAHVHAIPVGCVRFDGQGAADAEVSIYLDPALQGLGLGGAVLRAGERFLLARRGTPVTVHATVLPGNEPSRRLFASCGYEGGPLEFRRRLGPAFPMENTNP